MLKIPRGMLNLCPLPSKVKITICAQVLYMASGARLQTITNKQIPFLNSWTSGTAYKTSSWPTYQVDRIVRVRNCLNIIQDKKLANWITNNESQNRTDLTLRSVMAIVFGQCQPSNARCEVHPSWSFGRWICMWLWFMAQVGPQVWVYMSVFKALMWNTSFLSELIVKRKPLFGKSLCSDVSTLLTS